MPPIPSLPLSQSPPPQCSSHCLELVSSFIQLMLGRRAAGAEAGAGEEEQLA